VDVDVYVYVFVVVDGDVDLVETLPSWTMTFTSPSA